MPPPIGAGMPGPPKHRLDAGHQFPRLERFGQIVICTRLQPFNPVVRLALGGQQQNRCVMRLTNGPGQGHAVLARHHHVEEDEVGFASCDHLSGVDGVVGLADDVKVRFEVVPGSGTCNVVIVDQKDPEALSHDTIPEQISTSVPRPGVLMI